MKVRLTLLLVLALFGGRTLAVERAPSVGAQSWLLVDAATGSVLAERGADRQVAPASLTKLMSVYLVFEQLKAGKIRLSDPVLISDNAARQRGSRMRLKPGMYVRVEDLLKAMLVRSANDATVAMAEHIAGSEALFVAAMNQRAKTLGLKRTTFVNSSGLDAPGHLSTARDMTRIATALIRDFPAQYGWFSMHNFEFNRVTHYNSNRLMRYNSMVDGMKTGFTAQAGWCLIASAKQGGTRLVATVLGSRSPRGRVAASKRLLDYGFRNFETHLVYTANQPTAQARIWLGESALVPLGPAQNLYVTLPRGKHPHLSAELDVDTMLYAPVRHGQPVGKLRLQLDNKVYAEYPLVALNEVPVGGVVQRAIDNVQLMWLR